MHIYIAIYTPPPRHFFNWYCRWSWEGTKSGIALGDVPELAVSVVSGCPNLGLAGLCGFVYRYVCVYVSMKRTIDRSIEGLLLINYCYYNPLD